MPVFCLYFHHLEMRIKELVKTFLADQIISEHADPTCFTPDPDRIAAFRLLVHAEFEEFIEKKAIEGLDRLSIDATAKNFRLQEMHQLLAISHYIEFDIGLHDTFDQAKYISKAGSLLRHARAIISDNNGIKRNSFLRLCIFYGVMPDDVDQTLLSTLDSYGRKRGDVAHRSISRIRSIYFPSVEERDAVTVVKLLEAFYDVHS